jgi:integrase
MSGRYRQGCLFREKRKAGPNVWVFRYRDGQTNRKQIVGTVEQFVTQKAAMLACESLRTNLNRETRAPRTVRELVDHYIQIELPKGKSFSTKAAYECYLTNWIVPKWGNCLLSKVGTVAVEEWLDSMKSAPGTRAKIRNVMSAVFTHAMRYEWITRNPITLVRQSAKRQHVPEVLTVDEIKSLLSELAEPYHTLVFIAAVTGLRVSELLALKWEDVQFDSGEIVLSRSIWHQQIGNMKTEASKKPLPLDAGLAEVLMNWRGMCAYNQPGDYIFASPDMHGTQPYWPENILRRHIRPAADRAEVKKHIGFHTLRHSFATILRANREDVKTAQELLRHANSRVTLDTYTQAVTPAKLEAQRKVVETLFVPMCSQIAGDGRLEAV